MGSLPSQRATTFCVHAESFRVTRVKFADLLRTNADADDAFADSPVKSASPTDLVTTITGIACTPPVGTARSLSGNTPPRPWEFRIPAQFACGGAITTIP